MTRAEELAAQREEDRAARRRVEELAAHPRTRLEAILKDLQTPQHDINDRIAALHRAVVGLFQLTLQHAVPPFPPEEDDAKE